MEEFLKVLFYLKDENRWIRGQSGGTLGHFGALRLGSEGNKEGKNLTLLLR